MSRSEQLYLQWHGKQVGPWSYEKVRHALQTGEIHSLYQILVDGAWHPLRDHLEHLDALNAQNSRETAEAATAALRQVYEQQLNTEKAEAAKLRKELDSNRDAQWIPGPAHPPPFPPSQPHSGPKRTSGLAIACFVLSLCNFVPGINFVSWLLSIVFGHVALSQIHRDEDLGGRGLAIAGLAITYSLMVFGFLFGLFWFAAMQGAGGR